ncbi:MAG: OmpA family protein [bacterium]|nr:OmpA family protein [bacterium]
MSKAKVLIVSLIWLVLLSIGVGLYRWWYVPSVARQEQSEQEEKLDQSGSDSFYRYRIALGLDAFSGYALLRSPEFQQELRSQRIKLELRDDKADYEARLRALAAGELQFAAFPIDALLKASSQLNNLDATIIAILDETQGADAMVAYKQKFPDKKSLLAAETRFVAVANSPSETLVRLLMNTFGQSLSAQNLSLVDSEEQLVSRYRQAAPGGDEVFVTWEPLVSQMLENDQLHKLYDSSEQSGVIVDSLVVSRDYLIKNKDVVQAILESYFKARYAYGNDPQRLQKLVKEDAKANGTSLSDAQAAQLVAGIVWKNTQENFAHFGLRTSSVTLIEDMIDRIRKVLMETGGLSSDPTGGAANRLFYREAMNQLSVSGFHPGSDEESVREGVELRPLSDQQWQQLVAVGTVDVPPLIYARGTARLTEPSKLKLDTLRETLKTFPRYYLLIRGNASDKGNDPEANKRLAKQRADAALQYLLDNGVSATRLRSVQGEITGQTSVTFDLAELPY